MAGLESSLKVRYTVRVRISEVRLGTLVKSWLTVGLGFVQYWIPDNSCLRRTVSVLIVGYCRIVIVRECGLGF